VRWFFDEAADDPMVASIRLETLSVSADALQSWMRCCERAQRGGMILFVEAEGRVFDEARNIACAATRGCGPRDGRLA